MGSRPALQESIRKVIELGTASGETAGLLQSLTGGTETDFKKMQATAEKYGIDLASLGPQFQSAKLHDSAKNLIEDFELLSRNGADVGGVLFGMRGEIGHLVSDSIKFKVDLPANMKPWIENLIDTRQLIDDNGVAITDLSALKFSEPIVTAFDTIVLKLQELIDRIAGPNGITAGINAIPTSKTIDIIEHRKFVSDADPAYGSRGGLVTAAGIQYMATGGNILPFRPRGTDTVPAMLTPGERVLSVRQNRAYEAGRGPGSTKVLEAEVKKLAAGQAELTRYMTGKFAKDNARAIRDEVQKVARR